MNKPQIIKKVDHDCCLTTNIPLLYSYDRKLNLQMWYFYLCNVLLIYKLQKYLKSPLIIAKSLSKKKKKTIIAKSNIDHITPMPNVDNSIYVMYYQ